MLSNGMRGRLLALVGLTCLAPCAMAVGTAITVSVLATIAVTAKNWAVAMAGDGRAGNRIHAAIEIAGAGFVFVIGLLLLTASLNA